MESGLVEWRLPSAFSSRAEIPAPFEFIGISHGTIAVAMDRFNRILAHPENFLQVGDPTREVAPPAIQLADMPLMNLDWWRWATPNCPIRRYFADLLAMTYVEIVALHEYSHLVNGHVGLLNERGSPREPLLLQTLEMDADSTAALYAIEMGRLKQIVWHGVQNSANADFRAAWQIAFSTPRRCFITLLIAGYTFLRTFDKSWDLPAQADGTHPQHAIRMRMLADCLQENLRNRPVPGYSTEQFVIDAGNVFGTTDLAIARMTGSEPNREVWESAFVGRAAAEYFYRLERKWAEVRLELDRHAKVTLLSPVDWSRLPKAPQT
jgi:hypothetical protein